MLETRVHRNQITDRKKKSSQFQLVDNIRNIRCHSSGSPLDDHASRIMFLNLHYVWTTDR